VSPDLREMDARIFRDAPMGLARIIHEVSARENRSAVEWGFYTT